MKTEWICATKINGFYRTIIAYAETRYQCLFSFSLNDEFISRIASVRCVASYRMQMAFESKWNVNETRRKFVVKLIIFVLIWILSFLLLLYLSKSLRCHHQYKEHTAYRYQLSIHLRSPYQKPHKRNRFLRKWFVTCRSLWAIELACNLTLTHMCIWYLLNRISECFWYWYRTSFWLTQNIS